MTWNANWPRCYEWDFRVGKSKFEKQNSKSRSLTSFGMTDLVCLGELRGAMNFFGGAAPTESNARRFS
jgi:hypothetical protein